MKRFSRAAAFLACFSLLFGIITASAHAAQDVRGEFISAANSISSATGSNDWQEKVEAAELAWEAYDAIGDSNDDAEIAAAYAKYIREKAVLDACIAFIDYVNYAQHEYGASYLDTKQSLADAARIYEQYVTNNTDAGSKQRFVSYEAINSAESLRRSLINKLYEDEEPFETFFGYAKAASESNVYAVVKQSYDMAVYDQRRVSAWIYNGHPDKAAAEAYLEQAEAFLDGCDAKVAAFILAVQAINDENISQTVNAAYAAYAQVDKTADGVTKAKQQLDAIIADYNSHVTELNDTVNDITGTVLGIVSLFARK